MISPSWNGPRTHLFDAPVVTTDVANHSSVHCVGPTRRRSFQHGIFLQTGPLAVLAAGGGIMGNDIE